MEEVKIIILYANKGEASTGYRVFELSDELKNVFEQGGRISIEFCNPETGNEIFIAKRII